MDIEDIEIGCDGCATTIRSGDECYCENCIDKRNQEIEDLEKRIESLESNIAELEDTIIILKAPNI